MQTTLGHVSGDAFRLLFERNPQPMLIYDKRSLAILAVNKAAESLYGYDAESFRRLTLYDIRPAEDIPAFEAALARAHGLRSGGETFRHRRRDGGLLHVEISSHDLPYQGRDARLVMIHDVSSRVHIERQLARDNAFLDSILDTMAEGVVACDAEGRLNYFNRTLKAILGLPEHPLPDNAAYRSHYRLLTPDGETPISDERNPLLRAARGEQVDDFHLLLAPAQGEARHVMVNARPLRTQDGKPAGAVAVVRDISEQRAAQQALQEQKRMLDDLMANLPGMVYRCLNTPEWPMVFVSPGARDLTGYAPGEVERLQGGYASLIHPEDAPGVWEEVQRALKERRRHTLTYRIRDRGGRLRWVWEQGRGVWNAEGALLFLEGFVTDITARHEAEQALEESERRYRAIFEESVEGLYRTRLDGRFEIVNPAFARILGFDSPEQLLNEPHYTARDIYFNPAEREALLKAVREQGVVRNRILRLKRRGGQAVWVSLNTRALRNEAGELLGMEGSIQDISTQMEAAEALEASEERFARAAEGANDGIWDWNLDSGEVYYSRRWCEQLGLEPERIGNRIEEWLDRIHPDDRGAVQAALRAHLEDETAHFEIEHRMRHRDGDWRWMLARGVKSTSHLTGNRHMAGSQTDITARKQAEQQLQHAALHDSLTGLPNRALLNDRLEQAMRRRRRQPDAGFALLYLDLDRFKTLNDSLGHSAGDALLMEVARRWQRLIRDYDTLARLGGDEFALLLEGGDDPEVAETKARQMLEALRTPVEINGQGVVSSVSIGIVLAHDGHDSVEELLANADTAMYRAKQAGRNRSVLFEHRMRETALHVFHLEAELRQAVSRKAFSLAWQAVVELATGRICGAEALLRWRHPKRGVIPPADFILLAEETGLIIPIGRWVLREACRQTAQWRQTGQVGEDFHAAVNLSARQLGQRDLVETILDTLNEAGLPEQALKVEVTESAIIENPDQAARLIRRLGELGVGTALDDFGTGYSSLAYLYRFPFDTLKVDRSFLQQLENGGKARHIMEAVLLLGERLRLTLIPEGVETAAQVAELRAMGFRHAQGYYFSRPVPAAEFARLLAAGSLPDDQA